MRQEERKRFVIVVGPRQDPRSEIHYISRDDIPRVLRLKQHGCIPLSPQRVSADVSPSSICLCRAGLGSLNRYYRI